jgi:hypothetical protein
MQGTCSISKKKSCYVTFSLFYFFGWILFVGMVLIHAFACKVCMAPSSWALLVTHQALSRITLAKNWTLVCHTKEKIACITRFLKHSICR